MADAGTIHAVKCDPFLCIQEGKYNRPQGVNMLPKFRGPLGKEDVRRMGLEY